MNSPLVSTHWLQQHLADPRLILLDASMQKIVGKTPLTYQQPCFIPGSQRCDLERDFINFEGPQVNQFPTVEQFNQCAQRLGIKQQSIVVIYDNQGIYSSPRAWWIFRAMGVENTFVLDGGLPKWLAEGRTTRDTLCDEQPQQQGTLSGYLNAEYLTDKQQILDNINSRNRLVIDARSRQRFTGKSPEPRQRMRSGHIPNAINLPFAEVLDGQVMKSTEALRQIFGKCTRPVRPNTIATKVELSDPLIFSCGSGITACILLLAAEHCGYTKLSLYDGSWSEWGADPTLPLEVISD